jgi:hypothetical protein
MRAGVRCSLFLSVSAGLVWSQQSWELRSWPNGQVTWHWISCLSRQLLSVVQMCTRTENSNSFFNWEKIHIKSWVFKKCWLAKKKMPKEVIKRTKTDSPIMRLKHSICGRKICGKDRLLSSVVLPGQKKQTNTCLFFNYTKSRVNSNYIFS